MINTEFFLRMWCYSKMKERPKGESKTLCKWGSKDKWSRKPYGTSNSSRGCSAIAKSKRDQKGSPRLFASGAQRTNGQANPMLLQGEGGGILSSVSK